MSETNTEDEDSRREDAAVYRTMVLAREPKPWTPETEAERVERIIVQAVVDDVIFVAEDGLPMARNVPAPAENEQSSDAVDAWTARYQRTKDVAFLLEHPDGMSTALRALGTPTVEAGIVGRMAAAHLGRMLAPVAGGGQAPAEVLAAVRPHLTTAAGQLTKIPKYETWIDALCIAFLVLDYTKDEATRVRSVLDSLALAAPDCPRAFRQRRREHMKAATDAMRGLIPNDRKVPDGFARKQGAPPSRYGCAVKFATAFGVTMPRDEASWRREYGSETRRELAPAPRARKVRSRALDRKGAPPKPKKPSNRRPH